MVTIESLFCTFETALNVNDIPEDFKNVIKLFYPGSITFKTTYYDGVQLQFLILVLYCKDILYLLIILKTSETLKDVLPK